MTIKGYIEYQRREFCIDIQCPVQLNLDSKEPNSPEYETIRQTCKAQCQRTAYDFHHWLIDNYYLIFRPDTKTADK